MRCSVLTARDETRVETQETLAQHSSTTLIMWGSCLGYKWRHAFWWW